MAAGLWPRQQAVAAGARRDLVAVAYRPTTGALVRTPWAHVTMDAYHAANALRLRAAASDRRDWRRLEQNTICGVVRARSWRLCGGRTSPLTTRSLH